MVRAFTITLKNYRCFEKPVHIRIGPGFTSIVGPNNGGKSSLIRSIYELREFFSRVQDRGLPTGNLVRMFTESERVEPHGVFDHEEVFCDRNTRPISVEFHCTDGEGVGDGRFEFTWERRTLQWRARAPVFPGDQIRVVTTGAGPVLGAAGHVLKGARHFTAACNALARSLYIGPFRNALNEGSGSHYDLSIGSSFVELWKEWKTGKLKEQNRAIELISNEIGHIFGIKKLEINAADQLRTLQIGVDGRPYKLNELGAGLAQFIVVFGNAAIRGPSYILIDEPELHLHPSLQIDFLTSLASHASEGVVFATHNLGLARATAERIYALSKNATEGVVGTELEAVANYPEFLGALSFGSYHALGFDRILLVEGVTEVKTLQQWLRLFGKDHSIVMMPLGGAQMINGRRSQELAELKRISKNISVLVDSERAGPGDPLAGDRADFEKECKALGFDVHLTDRRATENYFSGSAVQAVLGATANALGPFDKPAWQNWSKSQNWRVAREMTRTDIEHTDVGAFLARL